MVLRQYLIGVLFDLNLTFRAALTISLYHLLPPLRALFLFSLFFYIICAASVHFHTDVCECELGLQVCKCVCVCVQLDDWPRSLNTKTWMKD